MCFKPNGNLFLYLLSFRSEVGSYIYIYIKLARHNLSSMCTGKELLKMLFPLFALIVDFFQGACQNCQYVS